jgi:probable biosynthetic protein (TIGR04099 family)
MPYQPAGAPASTEITEPDTTFSPTPDRLPPWTTRGSVLLGMPQLDACGLSETWLQKTCGERHWRGLADTLGLPAQRWQDGEGKRVYAAFAIVRLLSARLDTAREGRRLHIGSRLAPVGRSQAWSHHRLTANGEPIGELEMLSVFVGRGEDGSNRSVRRVPMRAPGQPPEPAPARRLVEYARAWRGQIAGAPAAAIPSATLRFLPCPRGDFNGAGLVYFASFTAWADRALFAWGLLGPDDRVVERECLYLGNLDLGHEVEVSLAGRSERGFEVAIRCPVHDRSLARIRIRIRIVTEAIQP